MKNTFYKQLDDSWIGYIHATKTTLYMLCLVLLFLYLKCDLTLESKIILFAAFITAIDNSFIISGLRYSQFSKSSKFRVEFIPEWFLYYILIRKGIYPLIDIWGNFESNWHILYRIIIIFICIYSLVIFKVLKNNINKLQDEIRASYNSNIDI